MKSVRHLAQCQRDVGLTDVGDPVSRFHDRPFYDVRPEVVEMVTASISAEQVRELPYGIGSVEQRSDNVNLLVDVSHRSGVRSSAC